MKLWLRDKIKTLVQLGFYTLGSLGSGSKIPVLMYHSIDETGSLISVSPDTFRRHLQYLKSRGYQAVSMEEYFQEKTSSNSKKVLITFDDGYQNLHTYALPILKEFSYTAEVFLVTDFIGKNAEWIVRDKEIIYKNIFSQLAMTDKEKEAEIEKFRKISQFKLLSWDEIRDMQEQGIGFQSHSHTHPFVSTISGEVLKSELAQSREILEEKLNRKILGFGYPYTDYSNPQALKLLDETQYKGAFIGDQFTEGRMRHSRYLITRIPLWENSTQFDFQFSLSQGYSWYKTFLQKLRKGQGGDQPSATAY